MKNIIISEGNHFKASPATDHDAIFRAADVAAKFIEEILNGRQPSTLQLDDLLKPLPASWDRQRSVLNMPQWPAPVERSPGRQN
jgi:hypothetical protein